MQIRSSNGSEKNGHKNIGIVVPDDPYYTAYVDAIRSHLQQGESLTVISNLLGGENDFKPSILKAKKGGDDIVGIFLFVGQISAFYRQSQQLNYHPKTFGADDFESRSEIAASQGGMNGAVFALNRIDPDFISRYQKRYDLDTHLTYAANAYEFANTIAALRQNIDPDASAEEFIKRWVA